MGVPMRMRCDNCGYDFVGQLEYSDQRQGDVIRCKGCDYEVPAISDEEIAEIETVLNKERNMGIYAMVAWAVCFVAMVVWGLSYFWQVGTGLGNDQSKNKEEILWTRESRTALYLKTNLSENPKVPIANSSILLNLPDEDPALTGKLEDYNAKLKKMNTALDYIGDSVNETLLKAKFSPDGLKVVEKSLFEQKFGQYLSKVGPGPETEPVSAPPADWTRVEDPGTKTVYYQSKTGEDVTLKSADPAGAQDLTLKLFAGVVVRPVDPASDDKPNSLANVELRYTEGDITIAYDPLTKRIVRTEIHRPAAGADPNTANAVVYGKAVVVPITLFPSDDLRGNHPPIQIAAFKDAKDTSPTSLQLLMMVLWVLAMLAAIPLSYLANKARYTMQLGIVEKEPEVEPEAPVDDGGDVSGQPEPEGAATAKMDDEIEIS